MIKTNSQKVALRGVWGEITYADLLSNIHYYSTFYKKLKVEKTVIIAENRPEWVFALYSAWENGSLVVPVDHMSTPDELAYILSDCTPELVFCSGSTKETVAKAMGISGVVPNVLEMEKTGFQPKNQDANNAMLEIPDVQKTALIIYTSGTTGSPKGVMLSFQNLLANVKGVSENVPIYNEAERVLMLLPLHHIFPLLGTLVCPLSVGATVAVSPSMVSEDIIKTLQDNAITIIIGVPRLYAAIRKGIKDKINASGIAKALFSFADFVNSPKLSKKLFGTVHRKFGGHVKYMVCGGAAIEPEIVRDFQVLGFDVLEGFGMTEAAPMITFTKPGTGRLGAAGQVLPGSKMEIRNGEVVAKGPQVMKGYYNKPKETAEVLKDGWLYTGDLGHIDDDGFLFITGRKKELIILSNGKNVNPAELENKLENMGSTINEVGVCSVDDTLHAVIYPSFSDIKEQGIENVEEYLKWDIIDKHNQKVSQYKKISGFTIVNEELPKTRLGKIQHFKLNDFIADSKKEKSKVEEPDFQEYKIIKKYLAEQLEREIYASDHLEMDLAMDSLGRVGLAFFLQTSFGVNIKEEELPRFDSVLKLAEYIEEHKSKISAENINWADIIKSGTNLKLPKSRLTSWVFRNVVKVMLRFYFRMRTSGISNLPEGPFILAPNHQSSFDGFFLTAIMKNKLMKRTYFYAKEKHFKAKALKLLARKNNIIIMDINKDLKESIQKLAEVLKKGKNVIIFPEGTRSKTGKMGNFKKTFAILSQELNVPVVPVAIKGIFESKMKGLKLPRPFAKIEVKFAKPVYPTNHSYESLRDLVFQAVQKQMVS